MRNTINPLAMLKNNNDILFDDVATVRLLQSTQQSDKLSLAYNDCTNNYNDCTNNVSVTEKRTNQGSLEVVANANCDCGR